MFARCYVCGRRLKSAESIAKGIGPVCDSLLHPCTHKHRYILTTVKETELDEKMQLKLFEEGNS
jgi:hypothetical protein